MPLSAELLLSAPGVHSDPEHFVETTIALRIPIGVMVDYYGLESVAQDWWFPQTRRKVNSD